MKKFKSFKDILAAAGITAEQFAEQIQNHTTDEIGYKKVKLIAKVLNGKWVPDYKDDDQWKYEPIFYHNGTEFVFRDVYRWISRSYVGSRLCFKSREIAEYAATTFIAEYREFLS